MNVRGLGDGRDTSESVMNGFKRDSFGTTLAEGSRAKEKRGVMMMMMLRRPFAP